MCVCVCVCVGGGGGGSFLYFNMHVIKILKCTSLCDPRHFWLLTFRTFTLVDAIVTRHDQQSYVGDFTHSKLASSDRKYLSCVHTVN